MAVTPNWRELLARYRVPTVLETVRGKALPIRADDDDLLVTPHSTGKSVGLPKQGSSKPRRSSGAQRTNYRWPHGTPRTSPRSWPTTEANPSRRPLASRRIERRPGMTPWDSTVPGEDLEIEAAETEGRNDRSPIYPRGPRCRSIDPYRVARRAVERGALAIAPMLDWLDKREFAAFAVRVLERIAREDVLYRRVVKGLVDARAVAASPSFERDIDDDLGRLGYRMIPADRLGSSRSGSPGPAGLPGKPGRRYWAMRTTTTNSSFIWSEVRRGHLRQGWGWMVEQDLRRLVELRKAGVPFSPSSRPHGRRDGCSRPSPMGSGTTISS